jgi:hypothetical protein
MDDGESPTSSDEDGTGDEVPNQAAMGSARRSSKRTKKLVAGGYREQSDNEDHGEVSQAGSSTDIETTVATDTMDDLDTARPPHHIDIDDDAVVEPSSLDPETGSVTVDLTLDEEEQKPKPMLKLGYSNFIIYGHCLCIVVEPWPPLSNPQGPSSVADLGSRSLRPPSMAPPNYGRIANDPRPQTLPECDRDETSTPFSFSRDRASVPSHHLSASARSQDDYDANENGGMIQFSQVLNSAGDFQTGVTDDDDGMDGAVFFGDADEGRES